MFTCPKHPKYQGKRPPQTGCLACLQIYENGESFKNLQEENERLVKQLRMLSRRDALPIHEYESERVKIGLITDTQLGSLYELTNVLDLAYKIFQQEGITIVYHAGDFVDGEKMYRGHEYELHTHGADAQVRHAAEVYPRVEGITTRFITGNHDLSFWKQSGVDIGTRLAELRSDFDYLGTEEADVIIKNGRRKIILRLSHPGKGTAYALSYHSQKYIEALTGGEKPNIIVMGHYHKSELLPNYRNICLIQGGCVQRQTPFMRRYNIAAMIGFWIIEFGIDSHNGLSRVKAEFIPYYEPSNSPR